MWYPLYHINKVYIRHANISGQLTNYFSNELNQPQYLPIDQTETGPIRVDIESPNVNNAESPYGISLAYA